jgi:hypothetical protein
MASWLHANWGSREKWQDWKREKGFSTSYCSQLVSFYYAILYLSSSSTFLTIAENDLLFFQLLKNWIIILFSEASTLAGTFPQKSVFQLLRAFPLDL